MTNQARKTDKEADRIIQAMLRFIKEYARWARSQ